MHPRCPCYVASHHAASIAILRQSNAEATACSMLHHAFTCYRLLHAPQHGTSASLHRPRRTVPSLRDGGLRASESSSVATFGAAVETMEGNINGRRIHQLPAPSSGGSYVLSTGGVTISPASLPASSGGTLDCRGTATALLIL